MNNDNRAFELFEQASDLQYSEPKRAIEILKQAVRNYPRTSTVKNYVIDSIIGIAVSNQLWDEAIEACKIAQQLKPEYEESYKLEAEACALDKSQRYVEATEIRLKMHTLHGEWYGDLRTYGDKFAELGAHDRAWELYNKAVIVAVKDGQSPHTVRVSMANLLIKENKPKPAGHLIITGIDEANKYSKKGVPKSLISFLKKILKSLGIKDKSKADEIAHLSKSKGHETAIKYFNKIVNPD